MNDNSAPLSAYFALWFPVLFVALWILASMAAAVVSGWRALAARFRCDAPPYGEVKTAGPLFYSVYARYWCGYGGVIRFTAAGDALYLSVLFLFRAGHPPLRVPWDEIRFAQTSYLWRRHVVLTLGNEEHIPMRISQRMARKLGIADRMLIQSPYPG